MDETAYLLRNNKIKIELLADRSLVNLQNVTKVELIDIGNSININSDTHPTVFDWTEGNGVLYIIPKDIPSPVGVSVWDLNCYLVVYDPSNPEGIVWGEMIQIPVKKI